MNDSGAAMKDWPLYRENIMAFVNAYKSRPISSKPIGERATAVPVVTCITALWQAKKSATDEQSAGAGRRHAAP